MTVNELRLSGDAIYARSNYIVRAVRKKGSRQYCEGRTMCPKCGFILELVLLLLAASLGENWEREGL